MRHSRVAATVQGCRYALCPSCALAKIGLPENATGALMTYMAGGKQYNVVPIAGANIPSGMVALSLP